MPAPSYAHGTSTIPLLGETIGENLWRTVERHGDYKVLVVGSQNYRATYREFWEQTSRAFVCCCWRVLFAKRVMLGC
jgi:fatty-acyl-CoA synthase